jgi:hypothetical protein
MEVTLPKEGHEIPKRVENQKTPSKCTSKLPRLVT